MKKIYLIATVVAIIAGFATYFFAVQIKESRTLEAVPQTKVVVAAIHIDASTVITEDMLIEQSVPTDYVTFGTVQNMADIVGMMTVQPINAGEQIIANKLTVVGNATSNGALSYQLEEGRYAYSINVDQNQGVSGFLTQGDYLNIYEIDPTIPNSKTQILLEHVKILRVSSKPANDSKDASGVPITSYSELILDVSEQDFLKLSNSQKNGAQWRFLLVPYIEGAGIEDKVDPSLTNHTIVINEYNEYTTEAPTAAEE